MALSIAVIVQTVAQTLNTMCRWMKTMKAILVIDMPKSCDCCRFITVNIEHSVICDLTKKYLGMADVIPDDCPLRPTPQKKDVTVKRIEDIQSYSITEVADKISAKIILKTNEIFALGWNACLDEITGETE